MEQAAHRRMRELQNGHWWFDARRRILEGLISELKPPSGCRILEVGCGPGGNLPMLSRFGEVTGLEPDAGARRHAAASGVARVRAGTLPDGLDLPKDSFDLVCAFDVLEHVAEDQASVVALGELVRLGGWIAATAPAYPWMWSAHDEAHHHKRRYRRHEFEALFRAAGLTVVKSSHFNAILLPLAVATRAIKWLLGLTSPDDSMPAPWLNKALLQLMASERGWLRRASLPLGLSLVVIARREPDLTETTRSAVHHSSAERFTSK